MKQTDKDYISMAVADHMKDDVESLLRGIQERIAECGVLLFLILAAVVIF